MSKTHRPHLAAIWLALCLAACGGHSSTVAPSSETVSQEQAEEAAIVQASMRDWTEDHKTAGYLNAAAVDPIDRLTPRKILP